MFFYKHIHHYTITIIFVKSSCTNIGSIKILPKYHQATLNLHTLMGDDRHCHHKHSGLLPHL